MSVGAKGRERERERDLERAREECKQEDVVLTRKMLSGTLLDGDPEQEALPPPPAPLGRAARKDVMARLEIMLQHLQGSEMSWSEQTVPRSPSHKSYHSSLAEFERIREATERRAADREDFRERLRDDDRKCLRRLAEELVAAGEIGLPPELTPTHICSNLRRLEALLKMQSATHIDMDALLAEVAQEDEDFAVRKTPEMHPSILEKHGVYYLDPEAEEVDVVEQAPTVAEEPEAPPPLSPMGSGCSAVSGFSVFDRDPMAKPEVSTAPPAAVKRQSSPCAAPEEISVEDDEAEDAAAATIADDALPARVVSETSVFGQFAEQPERLPPAPIQSPKRPTRRRSSANSRRGSAASGRSRRASRHPSLIERKASRSGSVRRVSKRGSRVLEAVTVESPVGDSRGSLRKASIREVTESLLAGSTCDRCRKFAEEIAFLRDAGRTKDDEILALKSTGHTVRQQNRTLRDEVRRGSHLLAEVQNVTAGTAQTDPALLKRVMHLEHINDTLREEVLELQRLRLEALTPGKLKKKSGVRVPRQPQSPTSPRSPRSPDDPASPTARRREAMEAGYHELYEQALGQVQKLTATRFSWVRRREKVAEAHERECMFLEDGVLRMRRRVRKAATLTVAKTRWNLLRSKVRFLALHRRVVEVLNYVLWCEGGPRALLQSALLRIDSIPYTEALARKPGARWALTVGAQLGGKFHRQEDGSSEASGTPGLGPEDGIGGRQRTASMIEERKDFNIYELGRALFAQVLLKNRSTVARQLRGIEAQLLKAVRRAGELELERCCLIFQGAQGASEKTTDTIAEEKKAFVLRQQMIFELERVTKLLLIEREQSRRLHDMLVELRAARLEKLLAQAPPARPEPDADASPTSVEPISPAEISMLRQQHRTQAAQIEMLQAKLGREKAYGLSQRLVDVIRQRQIAGFESPRSQVLETTVEVACQTEADLPSPPLPHRQESLNIPFAAADDDSSGSEGKVEQTAISLYSGPRRTSRKNSKTRRRSGAKTKDTQKEEGLKRRESLPRARTSLPALSVRRGTPPPQSLDTEDPFASAGKSELPAVQKTKSVVKKLSSNKNALRKTASMLVQKRASMRMPNRLPKSPSSTLGSPHSDEGGAAQLLRRKSMQLDNLAAHQDQLVNRAEETEKANQRLLAVIEEYKGKVRDHRAAADDLRMQISDFHTRLTRLADGLREGNPLAALQVDAVISGADPDPEQVAAATRLERRVSKSPPVSPRGHRLSRRSPSRKSVRSRASSVSKRRSAEAKTEAGTLPAAGGSDQSRASVSSAPAKAADSVPPTASDVLEPLRQAPSTPHTADRGGEDSTSERPSSSSSSLGAALSPVALSAGRAGAMAVARLVKNGIDDFVTPAVGALRAAMRQSAAEVHQRLDDVLTFLADALSDMLRLIAVAGAPKRLSEVPQFRPVRLSRHRYSGGSDAADSMAPAPNRDPTFRATTGASVHESAHDFEMRTNSPASSRQVSAVPVVESGELQPRQPSHGAPSEGGRRMPSRQQSTQSAAAEEPRQGRPQPIATQGMHPAFMAGTATSPLGTASPKSVRSSVSRGGFFTSPGARASEASAIPSPAARSPATLVTSQNPLVSPPDAGRPSLSPSAGAVLSFLQQERDRQRTQDAAAAEADRGAAQEDARRTQAAGGAAPAQSTAEALATAVFDDFVRRMRSDIVRVVAMQDAGSGPPHPGSAASDDEPDWWHPLIDEYQAKDPRSDSPARWSAADPIAAELGGGLPAAPKPEQVRRERWFRANWWQATRFQRNWVEAGDEWRAAQNPLTATPETRARMAPAPEEEQARRSSWYRSRTAVAPMRMETPPAPWAGSATPGSSVHDGGEQRPRPAGRAKAVEPQQPQPADVPEVGFPASSAVDLAKLRGVLSDVRRHIIAQVLGQPGPLHELPVPEAAEEPAVPPEQEKAAAAEAPELRSSPSRTPAQKPQEAAAVPAAAEPTQQPQAPGGADAATAEQRVPTWRQLVAPASSSSHPRERRVSAPLTPPPGMIVPQKAPGPASPGWEERPIPAEPAEIRMPEDLNADELLADVQAAVVSAAAPRDAAEEPEDPFAAVDIPRAWMSPPTVIQPTVEPPSPVTPDRGAARGRGQHPGPPKQPSSSQLDIAPSAQIRRAVDEGIAELEAMSPFNVSAQLQQTVATLQAAPLSSAEAEQVDYLVRNRDHLTQCQKQLRLRYTEGVRRYCELCREIERLEQELERRRDAGSRPASGRSSRSMNRRTSESRVQVRSTEVNAPTAQGELAVSIDEPRPELSEDVAVRLEQLRTLRDWWRQHLPLVLRSEGEIQKSQIENLEMALAMIGARGRHPLRYFLTHLRRDDVPFRQMGVVVMRDGVEAAEGQKWGILARTMMPLALPHKRDSRPHDTLMLLGQGRMPPAPPKQPPPASGAAKLVRPVRNVIRGRKVQEQLAASRLQMSSAFSVAGVSRDGKR
eukprot:TRINITY_DN15174_c0_g2_i1.p1 TRINITY_DN15174_c0_g2~~TRINITY_DN15174_c0_g2_i1.p1  ORF type:complete len:2456 (+),score=829.71 TRINITY_DN15174_c0_g2_i1:43-7368(+)